MSLDPMLWIYVEHLLDKVFEVVVAYGLPIVFTQTDLSI
jgi:hypothetical protein